MQKAPTSSPPTHAASDGQRTTGRLRDIVIPHEADATPLTAVRNVLLQASLAELKAGGHYERYTALIAPDVLEELLSSLGPGWIPVSLALAHYDACERLSLSADEFAAMGKRVGDRVHETVLVSTAKKSREEGGMDLWEAMGPLTRMWPRLFKGGSVQRVRIGPKELMLEEWGFRLNAYDYYRQAHLAALRATYAAVGVRITQVKIVSYNARRDEMVVRICWT